MKRICIKNLPEAGELLYSELQNGFYMEAAEGTSIRSFLTNSCGIPESYIKDKIKTIFHNNNPVDSLDSVKVSNGSVCAVSGAMPGLVGAMMRMGSPYASMRESITEKGEDISATGKTVFVKLKLFNVILGDLGQGFISGGVIFDRDDVVRIINKIAVKHGSSFSFKVDDLSFNSSKSGKLSDEKYIIKSI
ncbi:MAG TPA: hypothetical protein PK514_15025 [Spirochaetota bacterium]|nr:hypothetical protein [Spirochaetota bacterium]